ncbi:MAG: CBS domain-containing protein [Bacillota bacterium]
MAEELLARDIMTTGVVTVGPDDEIEKAARLLVEHRISGLPVVDREGRVVGIISEADLVVQEKEIRAPVFTVLLGSIIYLENPNRFLNELRRLAALRVGELMSRTVYTVGPGDPVRKIATIMVEKGVNRVPVVDKDGKLLGIVSRQDIVRATHGK